MRSHGYGADECMIMYSVLSTEVAVKSECGGKERTNGGESEWAARTGSMIDKKRNIPCDQDRTRRPSLVSAA